MATTPKKIVQISEVSDSQTLVYTNPSGTTTYLKLIVTTNNSGSACNISVWVVPSGDSPENANRLVPEVSINSKDLVNFHFGDPGIMLDTDGDEVYVQAGAAASLNIHMYGYTS